ncbi:polysaccharide deacetylase family protein [Roseiarcaceae bacterium H3SJ34-1]|uniref:polysaccharide deacetylase family protein n=1 Tax=Terripilifer ovatus TaxID=3032367 RepID=UPI003AB98E83|nr:polysaccharide deacetylase family protein [Roseiarcaceae bacterium H3SJ34-1]
MSEQDRVIYSPIIDRPKIRWPNNARVAFWISPNAMFYEYQPPANALRDPWPRVPHPDVRSYGHQDYGNRVGFWRMLEIVDQHAMPCTAAINVAVLQHFPEMRKAMVARDWNYMSHGLYNTRYLWDVAEDDERAFYRDIIDTVYELTGKRVIGAMGPGPQSVTSRTPDLLAEAGILYQADWFHDDQPFPINVRQGRLISMPYTLEISDSSVIGTGAGTAWEGDDFAEIIKRQFDTLYEEGADSGRVMCISLHAYLIAQPHRARYLDEALSYILAHDGVWKTTAEEIATYYFEHCYDEVASHLGHKE